MVINGTDKEDTLGNKANASGADKMYGKKGGDKYLVNHVGDRAIENANEGIDTVKSSVNYVLDANVEYLALTGTAAVNGRGNALDNRLYGNASANTLWGMDGKDDLRGGDGKDVLEGGGGNDELRGGAGNDVLKGGAGNDELTGNEDLKGGTDPDTLIGGTGNDKYFIDVAADVIKELANQGDDTVISYHITAFTLGNEVENLILKDGSVNGTGNASNNRLVGNGVANTLNGLAGNDTLIGKAGADILNGGDGNDVLEGGEGADILSGGIGKDTYDLAETTSAIDTVVVGDNTTPKILADYLGNTDVVKGFQLGVDKLDVLYANIVDDTTGKVTGENHDSLLDPDVVFGNIVKHEVSKGIYTFYDAADKPVEITTANQKNAYAYVLENTPLNGSIAGFHVTSAPGKTDTIIMQHNHTTTPPSTTQVEHHIVVDLVGVNATSLDASWII